MTSLTKFGAGLAPSVLGAAVFLLLGCSPSETRSPQPQVAGTPTVSIAADPLRSWNDGAAKQSILEFVARVTDPVSGDFVPESGRVATFDNDGTLWAEQPLYFQLLFAADRVKTMSGEHPEWRTDQPFKAILEDDREALAAMGHHEIGVLLAATHAGVTAEEFSAIARAWLDTARHPRFDRPFDEMIYQPMLEVLEFLRANGFRTFIVSGGGIEFIRTFSEQVYGIPRDQVVGSSIVTEFRKDGDRTFLMRLPELNFFDDKEGKPVAINLHIGQRPIAAFGNSDGDLQMLQYIAGGDGATLAVLVHHDDAEREYAYDRESSIGRLDAAWDEAEARGWTVVSMRDDWQIVFRAEN
jgi:phosphoserine phosphatase